MNWQTEDSIPDRQLRRATLDALDFFKRLPPEKSAIIPEKEFGTARTAANEFRRTNPGFRIRFQTEIRNGVQCRRAWKERIPPEQETKAAPTT